MAWTTPRTWPANENTTAAVFNTHVRDNLLYLYEHIVIGNLSITPSAPNTPTTQAVVFPFTLPGTPYVVISAQTAFPGVSVTGVAATSETTTGFNATVTRTTTTTTGLNWIAVVP